MEIGTIGAGAFAQAFAKRALKAGHTVKLSNQHGPDSLRQIVHQLGPGATAASKEEAATCDMVLLAVPWDNVPDTLASLPKWNNQILIDGTNPFHGRAGKFTLASVGNLSTSQFIAALGCAAVWPVAAKAQPTQKIFRIGYVASHATDELPKRLEAFRAGLRERGYEEGRNIVIELVYRTGSHPVQGLLEGLG